MSAGLDVGLNIDTLGTRAALHDNTVLAETVVARTSRLMHELLVRSRTLQGDSEWKKIAQGCIRSSHPACECEGTRICARRRQMGCI
jgi:hypothetical protein